jgi:hypothetical protein
MQFHHQTGAIPMHKPKTLHEQQPQFKIELVGWMVRICHSLELTQTQRQRIETCYHAVGNWLAEGTHYLLKGAAIYPQGSIRLRTTVKPIGQDEFDVDLIIHLPKAYQGISRKVVLQVIKDRLNEHETYKQLLKELKRGFRVNYAGDYHLDITPAIDYHTHPPYGHPVLVPDRDEEWKSSNPKGMANIFEEASKRQPRYTAVFRETFDSITMSQVESLPDENRLKTPLQQITQLAKRNRDVWAMSDQGKRLAEYKPISVLLTTLLMHSYTFCTQEKFSYNSELDFLLNVIENMPSFITSGADGYHVDNPTVQGENFAEKWNKPGSGQRYAEAFFTWHRDLLSNLNRLAEVYGEDEFQKQLKTLFGERPVNDAANAIRLNVSQQRVNRNIRVGSGGLLLAGGAGLSTAAHATVRPNNFWGRHP